MKTKILSWLCFHANTGYKSQRFYEVKNMLIQKYGKPVGDDIQYLAGNECWSCEGTGTFYGYHGKNICYKCAGTGMYTDDRLVHLRRLRFGKYEFHQPVSLIYLKQVDIRKDNITIRGYITHEKTKYCSFARFVMFLIYEKGYLKRWWRETGNGWRLYPFHSFENFIYDMVHFFKKGIKAYPIVNFTDIIKSKFRDKQRKDISINEDDLPF